MKLFDGLSEALIGYGYTTTAEGERIKTAIYEGEKIVAIFIDQGMTDEEAREYIDHNVEGLYCGADTPVVCWEYDPDFDSDC